jgi:hypothetical protein
MTAATQHYVPLRTELATKEIELSTCTQFCGTLERDVGALTARVLQAIEETPALVIATRAAYDVARTNELKALQAEATSLVAVLESAAADGQTRAVYYSAKVAETEDVCALDLANPDSVCVSPSRLAQILADIAANVTTLTTENTEISRETTTTQMIADAEVARDFWKTSFTDVTDSEVDKKISEYLEGVVNDYGRRTGPIAKYQIAAENIKLEADDVSAAIDVEVAKVRGFREQIDANELKTVSGSTYVTISGVTDTFATRETLKTAFMAKVNSPTELLTDAGKVEVELVTREFRNCSNHQCWNRFWYF